MSPRVFVYRGDMVESRHRVTFAVANASGESLYARGKDRSAGLSTLGDQDAAGHSSGRNAVLPMAFELTPAELALACASHGGEPRHADAVHVLAWNGSAFTADDLECGAHAPSHAALGPKGTLGRVAPAQQLLGQACRAC